MSPSRLDPAEIDRVVRDALAEDLASRDRTTDAVVAPEATATAIVLLKEAGVVCGLEVAEAVFRALDPGIGFEALSTDGVRHDAPHQLARVSGRARPILSAERSALNLLGRLSGIATLTRRYVDAVAGSRVEILDTRKTTPGLRALEKYAVRCGGGRNHRFGLNDGILIKDNHLRVAGSIAEAVERAKTKRELAVEVECDTLEQVREAVEAGADAILLDNMTPAQLRNAVQLVNGRTALEASGGVTLETVREIAETGVDFVSVGALTHSARFLDVSLEVV